MVHGVTTEWDDIQVKMGNYKPHEKVATSEQVFEQTINDLEVYDNRMVMSNAQLEEKAEEDLDFDEDEFMQVYRQQRMAQIKEKAALPRFGSVYEITKQDWDQEVTRAPKDVDVIVILYQNYVVASRVLCEIIDQMAVRHPNVKFVKSVATSSVENFHDRHVPAMFIYRNGEVVSSELPCTDIFGGVRMTVGTVEYVLAQRGIVEVDFEEDPRDKLKLLNMVTKHGKDVARRHEIEDVDEDGDDREYVNNQYLRYK